MNDLKSKLPDLNEISNMAGKLFKDVKTSILEIAHDYREKHPSTPATTSCSVAPPAPPKTKAAPAKAKVEKKVESDTKKS